MQVKSLWSQSSMGKCGATIGPTVQSIRKDGGKVRSVTKRAIEDGDLDTMTKILKESGWEIMLNRKQSRSMMNGDVPAGATEKLNNCQMAHRAHHPHHIYIYIYHSDPLYNPAIK